jgi:L-lactate dehydrogenase complex protein LldE
VTAEPARRPSPPRPAAGSAVTFFSTCLVNTVAGAVGRAAVRVLERQGHRVIVASKATCCGQPAWNSGFAGDAARVARTTLDALEAGEGPICTPSGSCATMMRVYWPQMFRLAGDEAAAERAQRLASRVVEFSELAARGPILRGRLEARVAYHQSCHMSRELGIVAEPIRLLEALEGCACVAWAADRCCGFGGTFAVKQPEISVAMADAKIDSLLASGAEMVVGCDESCLMHLAGRMRRRGIHLPVRHLALVLDEAAERAGA